jgi:integrase
MPRRPDPTQGLEKRTQADGQLAYRASVRIPGTTKKARGRWTTNLAEARSERAKLLASQEALAERAAAPTFPTVAEALETFLQGAEDGRPWARGGKPFAPKTLRGYRQDAALWIVPALGDFPVDRLRRSHVQALVDEVEALRSGQRARNVSTVLQSLYRHLLPRHDDLNDPTHGLELPSGSKPRNVIATPDELDGMIDALDAADRAPFGLAALAGLRAGELKGLQVADVILDAPDYVEGADVSACARIVVRAGWDAVEGRKGAKHRDAEDEGREVPVFPRLRPLLEAQLATLGPEVDAAYPFLPGKGAKGSRIGRGMPLDTDQLLVRCRDAWERAGQLGPEGFRLHDARHSFASALVLAGFDVATVAEWIGHRQASTTLDRYVKPLRRRGVAPAAVRAWLGA